MHVPKGSSTVRTQKKNSMSWVPYAKFVDEKITIRFLFSVVLAAFGPGFQHGYNLGVMNAPQDVLTEWIKDIEKNQRERLNQTVQAEDLEHEADFFYSIIVSIYSIGGICGGLSIAFCYRNKYIGFKRAIQCCNILAFLASFLMGYSKYRNCLNMMMTGRFLMGVSNALGAGVVITYLAEISPTGIRGTICSIYPLFLTVSTMISQFLSVDVALGTRDRWPYIFFLLSAIAIIQCLLVQFCVDSPITLYEMGKTPEAQKSIQMLYGDKQKEVKFTEIAMRVHYEIRKRDPRFRELFSRVESQSALMVSCVIMFAQQITGISVISHYTSNALDMINFEHMSEQIILIIGLANVCATIVSVAIVDMVGRRRLLIFSFATMFIDMLIIFTCFSLSKYFHEKFTSYIAMICMIMYVAFFASGAGSIPWFLYAEFFLDGMRPIAGSIAIPINWLTHFLVGLPFLSLHHIMGPFVFIVFAIMDFILLFYIIIKVPETKGKHIPDIVKWFVPKTPGLSVAEESNSQDLELQSE